MASAGGAGRGGGKRDGGKGEGSLARRAWRQYLLQLQQHRSEERSSLSLMFLDFMITAGCLAGVSDSVAQKLSGYQKIEKRRLLLKMLFGFAYGGPFGHFLHKILDYIFQGKKDTKTIAKKKYEIRAMHLESYLIHTYPIFECREAFEGGDDQGKETIPFCAIELLDGGYL
ncbi:unnamed protein product [Miscanthus lutarioriparius]|uniref:Uncharacterized protein n=1 Tax=Miscanthus lutarioriparius TaxID=422564 RepID=A0A811PVX6_9POAL|nr:unnamed protein product [Miscanthus lutarioriparius]